MTMALAGRALTGVLRGLAATWRFDVAGGHHLARVASGPFVYALWHRTLLPLLWWHRYQGITLLVSAHQDGELLARAAAHLEYRLVRGSSTRGGRAGYRGLLQALAGGSAVAVTPDGPTGPPGIVKPGVVRVAARAGVPILPVAARVDRAWTLRTWDGLVVPRPFSRILVQYGSPWLPHGSASECAGLQCALDALAPVASPEAA